MYDKRKLTKFWDMCDPVFSHIEISNHLGDLESLIKSWETNFISEYNFRNKTIIDYGIGGGYLGLYLFRAKNLFKYIGFDISERQIKKTENNLSGFNIDLYKVDDYINFGDYNADIFICNAVIQHFPDEPYLIDFLDNLNNSGIQKLMLQIRYNDETLFNSSYNTTEDVRLACQTNSNYLLNYLINYKLVKSKMLNNKSNYEFLFFEKI